MSKYDYIVGIDPDTDKSGVVTIYKDKVYCECLEFPRVIEHFLFISRKAKQDNETVVIVVEAGWLNETHFHLKTGDSRRVSAAKGNSVGRNHETGRKIIEMAKHYGLEVVEQRPLRKYWKGQDGKITHEELKQFIPELPSRTNQEVRDAALIAWNYAGFPIRIQPNKSQ